MRPIYKIFIGGGGDDWFTHIVEDYAAEYAPKNPAYACSYYSWTAEAAVCRLVKGLSGEAHVTIVGHSYGGDAAFSAANCGRRAEVLISIDPVGRLRSSWASIRSGARIWLNVRAEPSRGHQTTDDAIAAIGGKYPRPPNPGQASAPDYSLIVDATHGAFRTMMRAASRQGVSGTPLLGGARVS